MMHIKNFKINRTASISCKEIKSKEILYPISAYRRDKSGLHFLQWLSTEILPPSLFKKFAYVSDFYLES